MNTPLISGSTVPVEASSRPSRSRAGIGALLGTVLAAAALAFGPASPALAHDELVGTSPTQGEVLEAAPEQLTLSFNNDIIDVGTVITVTAADGTSATAGDPQIAGREVHQALNSDLIDGSYEVVWRVVSSDGHPISGVLSFAIGAATTEIEEPGATDPEAEHSHDESTEHAHDEDAVVAEVTAQPQESVFASPALWIGIGGSLALIILVVVLTTRSAQRRAKSAADDAPSTGDGDTASTER